MSRGQITAKDLSREEMVRPWSMHIRQAGQLQHGNMSSPPGRRTGETEKENCRVNVKGRLIKEGTLSEDRRVLSENWGFEIGWYRI